MRALHDTLVVMLSLLPRLALVGGILSPEMMAQHWAGKVSERHVAYCLYYSFLAEVCFLSGF